MPSHQLSVIYTVSLGSFASGGGLPVDQSADTISQLAEPGWRFDSGRSECIQPKFPNEARRIKADARWIFQKQKKTRRVPKPALNRLPQTSLVSRPEFGTCCVYLHTIFVAGDQSRSHSTARRRGVFRPRQTFWGPGGLGRLFRCFEAEAENGVGGEP